MLNRLKYRSFFCRNVALSFMTQSKCQLYSALPRFRRVFAPVWGNFPLRDSLSFVKSAYL